MATAVKKRAKAEEMSFERFVELMQTKFSLDRTLHTHCPSGRKSIWKSINAIQKKLKATPRYEEFMFRYSQTNKKVG